MKKTQCLYQEIKIKKWKHKWFKFATNHHIIASLALKFLKMSVLTLILMKIKTKSKVLAKTSLQKKALEIMNKLLSFRLTNRLWSTCPNWRMKSKNSTENRQLRHYLSNTVYATNTIRPQLDSVPLTFMSYKTKIMKMCFIVVLVQLPDIRTVTSSSVQLIQVLKIVRKLLKI